MDGNGILHSRGFGLASHLGVLVDIPTIGVGKSYFIVDGLQEEHFSDEVVNLTSAGSWFPLVGHSGRTWGAVCAIFHSMVHTPTKKKNRFFFVRVCLCFFLYIRKPRSPLLSLHIFEITGNEEFCVLLKAYLRFPGPSNISTDCVFGESNL